jgi:hypothetical protein
MKQREKRELYESATSESEALVDSVRRKYTILVKIHATKYPEQCLPLIKQ